MKTKAQFLEKILSINTKYTVSYTHLSEELHISRKEAETYIKEYFIKHKKVKEYMDTQIELCRDCLLYTSNQHG